MKQDGQPGRSSVRAPARPGTARRCATRSRPARTALNTREITVNSSPRSSHTSAPNTPISQQVRHHVDHDHDGQVGGVAAARPSRARARRRPAAAAPPAICRARAGGAAACAVAGQLLLQRPAQGVQRADRVPDVAEQGGHHGDADPDVDPEQHRRRVGVELLAAEQAAGHGDHQAHAQQPAQDPGDHGPRCGRDATNACSSSSAGRRQQRDQAPTAAPSARRRRRTARSAAGTRRSCRPWHGRTRRRARSGPPRARRPPTAPLSGRSGARVEG